MVDDPDRNIPQKLKARGMDRLKKDMASGLYVIRVRVDVFLLCVVLCGVYRNLEIKESKLRFVYFAVCH